MKKTKILTPRRGFTAVITHFYFYIFNFTFFFLFSSSSSETFLCSVHDKSHKCVRGLKCNKVLKLALCLSLHRHLLPSFPLSLHFIRYNEHRSIGQTYIYPVHCCEIQKFLMLTQGTQYEVEQHTLNSFFQNLGHKRRGVTFGQINTSQRSYPWTPVT